MVAENEQWFRTNEHLMNQWKQAAEAEDKRNKEMGFDLDKFFATNDKKKTKANKRPAPAAAPGAPNPQARPPQPRPFAAFANFFANFFGTPFNFNYQF